MHAVIDSIAYTAATRIGFAGIKAPEDEERVLFLHLKNNLGPAPRGLAARIKPRVIDAGIETTAVEWEPQHVNAKADDLMGRKGGNTPTETEDLADFLRSVLAAGPMKVTAIEKEGRDAGLLDEGERVSKSKAFRRAKEKLKIVRDKLGMKDGWAWALPTSAAVEMQDITVSPGQFFEGKLH